MANELELSSREIAQKATQLDQQITALAGQRVGMMNYRGAVQQALQLAKDTAVLLRELAENLADLEEKAK